MTGCVRPGRSQRADRERPSGSYLVSGGRGIRTHGDVAATMVFKSIRGSVFEMATTWAFSMLTFHVVQDHPVHIPRRRGLVFTRRLVGDDHQACRLRQVVQDRLLPFVCWADIP
jgi:hypothetical protein